MPGLSRNARASTHAVSVRSASASGSISKRLMTRASPSDSGKSRAVPSRDSMGIGRRADIVAGKLSHVLHGLRGPRESTISELGPYLDRSLGDLFPEPPPLVGMRKEE